MRRLPEQLYQDENSPTVVVRTDYADESAWRGVLAALARSPWDFVDGPVASIVVQGAGWDGATLDEVVAAAAGTRLRVIFMADGPAMTRPEHPLLAVTTRDPGDALYASETRFGRAFRTVPSAAHAIHINLGLSNMDFHEFAGSTGPDGVFHGFGGS